MPDATLIAALAEALNALDTRPEPRAQQAAYRDAIITAARAVITDHEKTTVLAAGHGPVADRERLALQRVWRALGCAHNPDDFKLSVRDVMWGQVEEFARESAGRDTRLDRDNRRLQDDLEFERARADEAELHPRDEYHTMDELYDYRMLYNALAFNAWAESGAHPVMKSWRHSDGELCFGGGWFIVTATLPTGLVSNHYRAEHWNLFRLPEGTPPEYDGHTPADAAERMRRLLTT